MCCFLSFFSSVLFLWAKKEELFLGSVGVFSVLLSVKNGDAKADESKESPSQTELGRFFFLTLLCSARTTKRTV
jgi:hypothetical protein